MDFLLKTNGNKQGIVKVRAGLAWHSSSKIVSAFSNSGSIGISIAESSTSIAGPTKVSISIGSRIGITRVAKTISSIGISSIGRSQVLGVSISLPLAIVSSGSPKTRISKVSIAIAKSKVSISVGSRVRVSRIAEAITRVSRVSSVGGSDAEADPQYLASTYGGYTGYSGYGLGYSGYPYSGAYGYGNLGYTGAGYGYSGLLGARGYYGKRDADAKADPQYLAGYTNAGYGLGGYAGYPYSGAYGYGNLAGYGYAGLGYARAGLSYGYPYAASVGECRNYLGAAVPC
jgi:hypothetical protein